MMKTLFLTSILCGSFVLSLAQFTLQDSLIAWYPFDSSTLDMSGNGNHGTLVNGPILSPDRNGNPGSAYKLDGVDDYITYTPNQKFKPQLPVTIAGWVLIDDYNANMFFCNDWIENSYHGVWLNIIGGRISAVFCDGGPSGPTSRRTKRGDFVMDLNTWYHVAVVINGLLDAEIYINGKEDCGSYNGGGGNLTYSNNDGVTGVGDGLSTPGPWEYFSGRVDEIRFYNRPLSQDEIQTLAEYTMNDTTISICLGDTVMLDAGLGQAFSWAPNSNISCTTCQTPLVWPDTTTVYQATSYLVPGSGCPDSINITVVVDSCTSDPCDSLNLVADFSYTTNGLTADFVDLSTGVQIDLAQWNFGDGNTSTQMPGTNISHTYFMSGTYEVCLELVTINGEKQPCRDTLCQWITVGDTLPPDTCDAYLANFDYVDNFNSIAFTDLSQPTTQISNWDFGDGNTATSMGTNSMVFHSYTWQSNNYWACLEAVAIISPTLTCRDTFCQDVFINIEGNLEDDLAHRGWGIAPNPASNETILYIDQPNGLPVQVELINMQGKVVRRLSLLASPAQEIKLDDLARGLYMVRLKGKGILGTQRLVHF